MLLYLRDEEIVTHGSRLCFWITSVLDRHLIVTNSEKRRTTYEFIPGSTFVLKRSDFGFVLSMGFLLTELGSLNMFLNKRSLSGTEECEWGLRPEDWRHVRTTCALYSCIRDLDNGIVVTEGRVNVSRALTTNWTRQRLEEFARLVFDRRRTMVGTWYIS